MTADTPAGSIERIIGDYGDSDAGPLVIAVAGLHGNEHAGVLAARRIISILEANKPAMRGRLVAVAGNLAALENNRRYLDRDLNRMWSPDQVTRARMTGSENGKTEVLEQRELIEVFDDMLSSHNGRVILADLHSTSAAATPFCIISDTLQNREIAFGLGVPVILGLEEAITGTIQEFFGECGYVTLAIEGGQHFQPATADRLESALWIVLRIAGLLRRRDIPGWREHRNRLLDISDGLPRVVEVFFRHGLSPDDGFVMREGFRNFSPLHRGELVASDEVGDIVAPEDGMLILPSYQKTGDDGFFMGRHVRLFWLRLSVWVRKLRLDRAIHILPGVRRDPTDPAVVYADRRVARWLALEVFHLAGYRKCHEKDGLICFKRRVER